MIPPDREVDGEGELTPAVSLREKVRVWWEDDSMTLRMLLILMF